MSEDPPITDARGEQGESFGRKGLSRLETEDGVYVARDVPVSVLGEYGPGESHGTDALALMGIDDTLPPEDQLRMLADISEQVAAEYVGNNIRLVPYERKIDPEGGLTYFAQEVLPTAGNNDPAKRLAYVPHAIEYVSAKYESFARLQAGEVGHPELFHGDVAKPQQYMVGVTDEDPDELLYLVDLDPEATPVGTIENGRWELSHILVTQIRDLAMVAHHHVDHEALGAKLRHLAATIEASGQAWEGYAAVIDSTLALGYAYEGEAMNFDFS